MRTPFCFCRPQHITSKMSKCIILFCFISFSFCSLTEQTPQFLSDEHIKQINAIAKTWKAKSGFLANTSKEYVAGLLGSKDANDEIDVKKHAPLTVNDDVPKNFDARTRWRSCTKIGHVSDQGSCGSCWAFGTTGAFADRLCVATKGAFNEQLSVEKLAFCCWRCGFACHGGYPAKAWKYFMTHGVVTGGDYGTNDGCEPYKVPPCFDEKGEYVCNGKTERHHWCHRSCYGNSTEAVRYKTSNAYVLEADSIMKDIMMYGPTEASFEVYNDFPAYASGVYQKTPNASYMGGHSVKLIGWGQEKNGPPYWLLVNSWSKYWGENGTFRIIRGRNECGIESSVTAGVPSV